MQPPSHILEYAPPPLWYRRRWAILTCRITLATFLLLLLGWIGRTFVFDWALCHYWLAQARSYSPPSMPVFSTDPKAIPIIVGSGGHVILTLQNLATGGPTPLAATYQPKPWQRLYTYFPPGLQRLEAIPFLHERTTPSGQKVLLAVDVNYLEILSGYEGYDFAFRIVRPTEPNGTRRLDAERIPLVKIRIKNTDSVTLFAGTPDTADQSRFTIPYSYNSIAGTISGTLNNDQTVTLHVDRGPLWLEPLGPN